MLWSAYNLNLPSYSALEKVTTWGPVAGFAVTTMHVNTVLNDNSNFSLWQSLIGFHVTTFAGLFSIRGSFLLFMSHDRTLRELDHINEEDIDAEEQTFDDYWIWGDIGED